MSRSPILLVFLSLAACSLNISEQEVFQPNPDNRRPLNGPLEIDRESTLPAGIELQHTRIDSEAGPIAITLAETDSDRLIVLCGGNAADRKTSGAGYLSGRAQFGDVMLFDYPGYGDSAGTPTAAEIEQAIAAVAAAAKEHDPEELIVWGQSLGGFICAAMASDMLEDVDAVVFETSARNAKEVAASWTPWYAKPFVTVTISDDLDAWDNVNALASFSGKVIVLGAGNDRVLPVSLSRSLAEDLEDAGLDTEYIEFEDAGHNNVGRHPGFGDAVNRALQGRP